MIVLIKQELHKLWSKKMFLIYFASLVFLNIFLMWFLNQSSRFPTSAYLQMTKDLSGKTIEEQYNFVSELYEQIDAVNKIDYTVKLYDTNPIDSAKLSNGKYREIFDKYSQVYKDKTYLNYTKSMNSELSFLKTINYEIEKVHGYEDYLNEIQKNADMLSSISIFNKEGSYTNNNIKATAKAYEGMSSVPINYYPQKGIVTALDFDISDIILIFIMILMSFTLVREERDNGLLYLIRSTQRGRLHTAIAKAVALIISLLVAVIILYCTNLVYCNFTYGLGDLTRTIQSVPRLMNSTLKVNLVEYLGLYMLTKWVAAAVTGIWILFSMTVAKSIMTGVLFSISMPLVHFLIRSVIPATHKLNVIKYANIISLLKTNEILGSYRNLHWFNNEPIQLNLIETVSGTIYFIVFISMFLFAFSKMQMVTVHRTSFNLLGKFKKDKIYPTTVKKQEWYKLLVMNGGAIFLSIIIIFQGYTAFTSENYIDADEMFYAYYMKEITGKYDEESRDFLVEESKKFEPIYYAQHKLKYNNITFEEYREILNANYSLSIDYNAYSKAKSRLDYIQYNPSAHIVYETGYEKLFNLNSSKDVLTSSIFSAISIILILSGFFTMEKTSGVKKVIYATPLGRNYTVKIKFRIAFIISCLVGTLSIFPKLWQIGKGYGYKGLFSPLMSLYQYNNVNRFIPIIALIAFMIISRIIACYLMSCFVLYISNISNSYMFSVMINTCIILFPLILYYMGINSFMYLSVYPLFDVARIFTEKMGVLLVLLYYFLALCGVFIFKDSAKEAYKK